MVDDEWEVDGIEDWMAVANYGLELGQLALETMPPSQVVEYCLHRLPLERSH